MDTQTIHQEQIILPASWFQKVEFTRIAGVEVIIGHWETEIGVKTYPIQRVICTLYHATIVHPSPNIQERSEGQGVITISSPDGINIKITNTNGFCLVQIWE